MAAGVRWKVLDDRFPQIIAEMRDRADEYVAKAAMDIQAQAQSRAPVDTGFLRASIQASRVGHAHWRVVVGADYGLYVEHGTRFQAARPFLQPAVDIVAPALQAAMRKVVG